MKTGWIFVCIGLGLGWVGTARGGDAAAPAVVQAMNRGVSLMGQYQYDEAARAFEDAVRAAPALADARINLAIALFNRGRKNAGDLDRAGQLLDEVLRQTPDHIRALYFQGIMRAHFGKSADAVAVLEKVVKQRPDDGAAWYLLGLCRQRLGQPSADALLQAVRCRPYLYSAYYKLYQVTVAAGNAPKAAEYLAKFQQLRESPLGESIELPQYNQMGDLALARPLEAAGTPALTQAEFTTAAPVEAARWSRPAALPPQPALGGIAFGDFNRDGFLDAVTVEDTGAGGRLMLWQGRGTGQFADATAPAGLGAITNALSLAAADADNDEILDLFVSSAAGGHLFKGLGNGVFTNVTTAAGLAPGQVSGRSAVFLDADHDGDLDLFVCNPSAPGCQLWNNRGDGVFSNVTATAGIACAESRVIALLPGDLDRDRDTDLVLLCEDRGARVFLNDLLGRYHETDPGAPDILGGLGGALHDFDHDGILDLLVLGGSPAQLRLFLGDGHGRFHAAPGFETVAKAAATSGPLRGFRVADLNLDGDLDIVVFGRDAHALLNDGAGRFVFRARVWPFEEGATAAAAEACDLTGDWTPDLLALMAGPEGRLSLRPGKLAPAPSALAIDPTGMRGRDKRTRSPATAYGTALTVRTGLREQRLVHTGLFGGPAQSARPAVFGLAGAAQADYAQVLWTDGVAQAELALAAGRTHKVPETQRKISSCPVLFTWNGSRFEFVTDFAGVGGLGYYAAPGVYAPPQVLEHIKIEAGQLAARDGFFELRVTEPMEEIMYVDRLELLAVDHPAGQPVFPDERLAISGPPPTHELLLAESPFFPIHTSGPDGGDCAARLRHADRVYAYEPPLDRRFMGFSQPHALELDFGGQLAGISSNDRVFLFINGFIEYPYSSTVYAAAQAGIGWEPVRVERWEAGQWHVIVPDAGAPGGMGRVFTIDLTGKSFGPACKLRLVTNLEICYDQIFLARHPGLKTVTIRSVPMAAADLRYAGFALEYSPDGRMPWLYDYEAAEASAPFHTLKGAYTRYGDVLPLLGEFDDQYVIAGPGDEIALRFNAAALPAVPEGTVRSFILASHAYCKDMDLYTGTPKTVEPLPFGAMTRYPYPASEHYPDTEATRHYRQTYNTRIMK